MKQVVSVSIGSSKRDHCVELELLGETFRISREGYNGDIAAAKRRFQELDGKVDALGMGGIDIYLLIDGKRYYFRASKGLARCTKITPILDGSGLKGPIEGSAVDFMRDELGLEVKDKLVVMPCSVDRWGLAQAFHDAGANVVAGDLVFTVGIDRWIRDWENLRRLVRIAAPIIMALPFKMIYPTGDKQEKAPKPKPFVESMFHDADIIAGDWQYVRKYMPQDMSGKWIVTNTTTPEDVELCRERGVELMVTSMPRLNGRSFGANVIEATLVALDGAKGELTPERYRELLDAVGFKPDALWLQQERG
ncbi:MAG: hypothetical protein IJH83_06320 [Coriobacteriales bacterium]|nr:hypothetical protein [Coriobacteriales bacterium]